MSLRIAIFVVLTACYLAVSCGSSPAPIRSADRPDLPGRPQTAVRPPPLPPPPLPTAATIEQISTPKAYNPVSEAVEPRYPQPQSESSTPQLSPRENLQKAILALQKGRERIARRHIGSILALNPGDRVAKNLLMQIDEPANNYLGSKFFKYRTRAGDTLSSISQKFLDDRYKFYGLARYNDISDPSRLRVNQVIKIPGMAPPSYVMRANAPKGGRDPFYKTAKRYYDQGRYQDVIGLLEAQEAKSQRGEKSIDILVLAYTEQAKIYTKKADLINARIILQRALKIQPKNPELKIRLSKIAGQLEADQYWEQGRKLIDDGKLSAAYVAFRKVLKRHPEHKSAAREIKKIKPVVIDAAYRQCMLAYKRHEFDQAIALCDKVLVIEPDHELAKLHRARAEEILAKLTNMKEKGN